MSTEYFHPKTTPNTPIKMAVRMSMALPGVVACCCCESSLYDFFYLLKKYIFLMQIVLFSGVFQSVKYVNDENTDVYVDGGLLCNYPIHAFDG